MSKKISRSVIWILPLIALLVTVRVIYEHYTSRGFVVRVEFQKANGISIDKTKVKYKNITVGQVIDISLKPDFQTIEVVLELEQGIRDRIRENTRFWIHGARIGIREISGLDTLLSGSYITFQPSSEGELKDDFVGLEKPPSEIFNSLGERFELQSDTLGNIGFGSGIYHKKIKVGQVTNYKLSNGKVLMEIYVKDPYQKLIGKNTLFWRSNISFNLSGRGVVVEMNNLEATLMGGIEFENYPDQDIFSRDELVKTPGTKRFRLFESLDRLNEQLIPDGIFFAATFKKSVRGLSLGAPIEYLGIKVGKVIWFEHRVVKGESGLESQIAVYGAIDYKTFKMNFAPGFKNLSESEIRKKADESFANRVKAGIFAELSPESLITGRLFLKIGISPEYAKDKISYFDFNDRKYIRIASNEEQSIERLLNQANNFMTRVENLPLERIFSDFAKVTDLAHNTMKAIDSVSVKAATNQIPEILNQTETIFSNFVEITDMAQSTLKKIDSLNLQGMSGQISEILGQINLAAKQVDALLKEIRETNQKAKIPELINSLNKQVEVLDSLKLTEEFTNLLRDLRQTNSSLNQSIDENLTDLEVDELKFYLSELFQSLNDMSLSIKEFTNFLQDNPNALIFGVEE